MVASRPLTTSRLAGLLGVDCLVTDDPHRLELFRLPTLEPLATGWFCDSELILRSIDGGAFDTTDPDLLDVRVVSADGTAALPSSDERRDFVATRSRRELLWARLLGEPHETQLARASAPRARGLGRHPVRRLLGHERVRPDA